MLPGSRSAGAALAAPTELGAARRTRLAESPMQLRIVLMGDQDLGDVALGGQPQRDDAVGSVARAGPGSTACRLRTVPCRDVLEIAYTVRRSERARRVRVTVDPARGVEVVLPAPRARARGGRRRSASSSRGSSAACASSTASEQRSRPAATTVPYLGELLRVVRRAGAHPRPPARIRAARAGRAEQQTAHSSAGTGARRRVEIAPRLERACALAGTLVLEADDPRASGPAGRAARAPER